MHRIRASLAVGLNWLVSMELMVLRDTPTSLARAAWERFCSVRISFRRFLRSVRPSCGYPTMATRKLAKLATVATRKVFFLVKWYLGKASAAT